MMEQAQFDALDPLDKLQVIFEILGMCPVIRSFGNPECFHNTQVIHYPYYYTGE